MTKKVMLMENGDLLTVPAKSLSNYYDKVCDFSEGLAAVVKDGKLGFVDTTGKVVIPLTYDCSMYEEFYFNHGLAVVAAGDFEDPDIFVIDENGNTAFDFKYDYARLSGYSEGCWLLLSVEIGDRRPYYWARSYNFASMVL